MRIEAAIPQGLYAQQPENLDTEKKKPETLEAPPPDAETSQSNLNPIGQEEDDGKSTESSRGVLRLLEEGHFKGVADVRLRINFADELAAIERSRTEDSVNQKLDGIMESVRSTLESDHVAETSLDSLIDPFKSAINQARDDFLESEVQSATDLIGALEAAAEKLVTSLTQEITSTNDLVSTLRATFSTAMDDLAEALNGESILPELAEPKGNGVAYDKFLAIYNEMQAPQEPLDKPEESGLLDTSA